MQSIITIAALILAIPTYGISLLFLIWYTVSTGKDRRNQIFHQIIREAYLRPGEDFVTNKVYYEAAEQFAKEHGALYPSGNSVAFDLTLGKERVSVWFGKGPSGELIVSVENLEDQMRRQGLIK